MNQVWVLPNVLVLIASAIFIVKIFQKLKLSPVLGYLVAGGIIGEHGLNIVHAEQTYFIAEYGVVFLLFAIGLELSFERLKAMRKYVFGLGSLQVFLTTVIMAGISMLFTGDSSTAIIIGGGLALSSTAIVIQTLEENHVKSTQLGRIGLGVILQQDFIVVPLLVIVPILAGHSGDSILYSVLLAFIKALVVLCAIFASGRLLFKPLFNLISSESTHINNELFIATTLLIALTAAWSTEYMGLSMALGAFVAGILVAETEFRVQAENSIAPFKGLLLGLFFMSVGMNINVGELSAELSLILFLSLSLVAIKAIIITGLCLLFKFNKGVSIHSGLLLSQGSEFAFVLFNLGMSTGIISDKLGQMLLLVVTFSMAITPILFTIGQKIAKRIDTTYSTRTAVEIMELGICDLANHVIIAGFGTVGKMVAKVLEAENINYIAVDESEDVVQDVCEEYPVFKGDVSQLDLLRATGIERALCVILTVDDYAITLETLKQISNNFPNVVVVVRTHDLKSANQLYSLGATIIVPEDYETGLELGGAVLKAVGISEYEISRIKNLFRAGNYVITQPSDEELEEE